MASKMNVGKRISVGSIKVNALKVNMDTLRGAADKIKNSPRQIRKKINHALHKEKLTEDWIHNREQVELGVMFNIKILGREDTKEEQGKGCTDKVVEELVQRHKMNAKTEKLQKASVLIDCDKVVIRNLVTHELIQDIPVKRICFCTADPVYPKVFAFMVLASEGSDAFIYAFLTNKKAMADAIALTVAQAYTMSFEDEHEKQIEKQAEVEDIMQKNAKNLYSDMDHQDGAVNELGRKMENTTLSIPSITNTYSLDSEDEEEDEFLAFAQSRKQLEIGHVSTKDFNSDVTDFLAVNNTLNDLERAHSNEDLFLTNIYPELMSPEFIASTNGKFSPTSLSGRSTPVIQIPMPAQQTTPPTTDDLIQF